MSGRRGLTQAITLLDLELCAIIDGIDKLFGKRGGSGIHHAYRAQIILFDDRMLAQKQDYRRSDITECDLLVLCDAAKVFNVKLGHYYCATALVEAHVQNDGQTINVEKGEEGENPIFGSQGSFCRTDLERVCNNVLVAQHDTFREARSAAGIDQECKILVRIDLGAAVAVGTGGVADRGEMLDSHVGISLVADQNYTVFR